MPRLALEGALLRPANERIDVEAALATLEQSSLIEIVRHHENGGDFVRVPLAALVFGQRKLRVNPLRGSIEDDSRLLQMFGATNRGDLHDGLDSRVVWMVREVARRESIGESITEPLAVLNYIARQYPPAFQRIAEFHSEAGRHPEAAAALMSLLEQEPGNKRCWLRLADAKRAAGDLAGELHALYEVTQLPEASMSEICHAAATLTRLYNKESGLEEVDRKRMTYDLIGQLTKRSATATATELSKLAWLHLHVGQAADARQCAEVGLEREPGNRYCLGLVQKLAA